MALRASIASTHNARTGGAVWAFSQDRYTEGYLFNLKESAAAATLRKKPNGVRFRSDPNYYFNRKRTSYGQTFLCTVHKMRLLIYPYDVRFRLIE